MKRLNFSIQIGAPKSRVWSVLLDDENYRTWTSVFSPGSHAVGNWEEGTKILFLGGEGSGMSSRIARHIPNEYISIEHLGMIANGVEDFDSPETRKWAGALENYSLTESDGVSTLGIEIDVAPDHENYFLETWPKALEVVKRLSENP